MAFDIPLSSLTYSRSVLGCRLVASAAPAPATTTSADFSLRQRRRPFRHKARSPQVRTHTFIAQPPNLRHPSLGHKSFVVPCPLALLGNAFYPVLVHRLATYAPRFLPTLGHPHAVALRFAHCDQLAAGLAPAGVRPCWAHKKPSRLKDQDGGLRRNQRVAGVKQASSETCEPQVSWRCCNTQDGLTKSLPVASGRYRNKGLPAVARKPWCA